MKAEIAREMIRSRSQMPIPDRRRTRLTAIADSFNAGAVGRSGSSAEVASGIVSGMNSYFIQNIETSDRLHFARRLSKYLSEPYSLKRRFTILHLRTL